MVPTSPSGRRPQSPQPEQRKVRNEGGGSPGRLTDATSGDEAHRAVRRSTSVSSGKRGRRQKALGKSSHSPTHSSDSAHSQRSQVQNSRSGQSKKWAASFWGQDLGSRPWGFESYSIVWLCSMQTKFSYKRLLPSMADNCHYSWYTHILTETTDTTKPFNYSLLCGTVVRVTNWLTDCESLLFTSPMEGNFEPETASMLQPSRQTIVLLCVAKTVFVFSVWPSYQCWKVTDNEWHFYISVMIVSNGGWEERIIFHMFLNQCTPSCRNKTLKNTKLI